MLLSRTLVREVTRALVPRQEGGREEYMADVLKNIFYALRESATVMFC